MDIRIRAATTADIDTIHEIIESYAATGLILGRSREDIAESIGTFLVAEHADVLYGLVSYHDYGPLLKEIRSLSVRSDRKKTGIGTVLLKTLIRLLLEQYPDARIFALSYSPQFFYKAGFFEVPKHTLPEKIWKDCVHCKNRDDCGETALVYGKIGAADA